MITKNKNPYSNLIFISDHCINRYREKINPSHDRLTIINNLKDVFINKIKVEIGSFNRVSSILRHNFEEANHYKYKNIVIVVKGNEENINDLKTQKVILTCYPYSESKFTRKKIKINKKRKVKMIY